VKKLLVKERLNPNIAIQLTSIQQLDWSVLSVLYTVEYFTQ